MISPYVEKYFGKRLNAKTYFIPNPVKEDFFHMQNCEQANRVLFAGRIIPRKGIEDLIKALVIIKDKVNIKVVLAGSADVDGIYLNKITKYIQDNKISDKIIFLGHINERKILNEFSRCSLMVLPSYQETAPMVIQQAMAAAKPVIATRICGIPYQVDDGKTGLLYESGNVEELSKHLLTMLSDKELRKTMGEKAKVKAYSFFQASKVAESTMCVYDNIIKR